MESYLSEKERFMELHIQKLIKRSLDVLLAFIALILLSPMLVVVSVLIAVYMGRPVLFCQQRPGLNGNLFTMYKFRTMLPPSDDQVWFRSDSERLTTIGIFLRKYSVDELPELINVIKGDMSLVGPRPLLAEYLNKYTEEENRRHLVLPGITGLAQVSGRQAIVFSKRLKLDVEYVENWSFKLDFIILIKTVKMLLSSQGVVSGQDVDEVDDIGLSSDRKRDGHDD
jgi:sugar transferase EpsL